MAKDKDNQAERDAERAEQERLAKALARTRAYLLSTPCSDCGVAHLGACVPKGGKR